MATSARNVFICFQMLHPEKGDEKVRDAIEEFGCSWAKLAAGTYYMHGDYDAQYIGNKIWGALNMDDKLVVIDSTSNDARWFNVSPEISQFLMDNWHAE